MPRRLWAILAVAFGVTLSVLDGTIVNIALPTIASEMHITEASSIWVVNAYQLSIMVTLLSFSLLGDLKGYRKIYLGGVALFTVASVCCSFSQSFGQLIASRVVQGIGASAIMSLNTTIIRVIYPRNALGRGMGINATVVAVAAVAGPTLASAVLAVTDWKWLFLINLPTGIAALILGLLFLPANPVKVTDRRFSITDAVMNGLMFGLLIYSIESYAHGTKPATVVAGLAATGIIGYIFIRRQLSSKFPLLPVDLMRIPIFSLSVVTSVISFIAQMSAMVAIPFYMQQRLGYSDVETGLIFTAWPAVIMVVAPIAGILVSKMHAGAMGGIGLTVMSAGLFLLALMPSDASKADIVWRLVMCGAGFGFFQSPNNSILIGSAPQYRSGSASGMLGTARLLGQTTGAALVALMFHISPEHGTKTVLLIAACFAFAGAVMSLTRLSLPLPEALRPAKGQKQG